MHYRLEPDADSVELLLFRRVCNAKAVRVRMLAGEFPAAFVKAALVRTGRPHCR